MTVDLERSYNVGALLLDCICETLVTAPGGCPDRRCLVPGAEAEHVNCCAGGGQLTVNVTSMFPSSSFPIADVGGTNRANCDAPYTVVMYGIEVIRCMPTGDMERAPDCNALDDVAHLTWTDMEAVRRGVYCCLTDQERVDPVAGHGYRWVFSDHITLGPEGACTGSNLQVMVGLPQCWECP